MLDVTDSFSLPTIKVSDNFIAFIVDELRHGTDLNGDTGDYVVHVASPINDSDGDGMRMMWTTARQIPMQIRMIAMVMELGSS